MGDATVAHDASAGAWIAPRLRGEVGTVTGQVPSGYRAYARICHPASDSDGRPVSWQSVASATGRTAHPLMQWHALVGSADPFNYTGSLWPGGDPARGNLAPHTLEALCELLAKHTSDAADCFFAVWTGWGWIERTFTGDELIRARLTLPERDYVLLTGPLSAASQLGNARGLRGFERQSPNLVWPGDHSWFVATEVDFDSTLVGGSAGLIEAILGAQGLDAWPTGPDASLAYDGDRVNKVPMTGIGWQLPS